MKQAIRKFILATVHAFRTQDESYKMNFTLSDNQMRNAWRYKRFRIAIKAMGGRLTHGKVTFHNIFAQRVVFDWLQRYQHGDLWNIVTYN